MAVAKVLRLFWITRSRQSGVNGKRFVRPILILENAHKSMQTDGEMRDSYGFDDCEDNGSLDEISR